MNEHTVQMSVSAIDEWSMYDHRCDRDHEQQSCRLVCTWRRYILFARLDFLREKTQLFDDPSINSCTYPDRAPSARPISDRWIIHTLPNWYETGRRF
jgi:hypothetical protein